MRYTRLLISVLVLWIISLSTSAQVTCNAEFNFQFTGPNTVLFTPLYPGDTLNTIHGWNFGNGQTSNQVFPIHTYANAGTYEVKHIVRRFTNSGQVACTDTSSRIIVIQNNLCTLSAQFITRPDSIANNPMARFFVNTSWSLSTGDSIRWTFGDGSSSNAVNGYHIYNQPGTYNVCLRIIKRNSNGGLTNCVSEICKTITIASTTCNLQASFFHARDTTSTIPHTLKFINTSTGLALTDSIRWSFGDGTFSNQHSPVHSYAQPGTYTVCLRIMKRTSSGGTSNCVSETCHIVTVPPATCNIQAAFNFSPVQSSPLYTYQFTNTSLGLSATDSIRWTFGDGGTSNVLNPSHRYLQPGTYTVCLRIIRRGLAGTIVCASEVCRTLVIPPACNLNPQFSWRADTTNARKIHFFNNTAMGTANGFASWSFGDGTTANSWNAVHEYAQPGRYYVCLVVQISNTCIRSYCDSITVVRPPVNCIEQSQFSITRAAGDSTLFHFTPAHLNNNWQYTWTFGDGTGSQLPVVSHRYPGPGNYNACLTVFRNANCASTTCKPVSLANCSNVQLAYTYRHDSVAVNKVYFHAQTNGTITRQVWTILKLNASTPTIPITIQQNNPVYIFADTGRYRVCLKATMSNGCIKEYCREIYIPSIVATNACNMQLFPNPATSHINIGVQLSAPQVLHVYVYNMLNILVREKHQQGVAGTNTVQVAVADLPAGIYRVTLIYGNNICNGLFQKL